MHVLAVLLLGAGFFGLVGWAGTTVYRGAKAGGKLPLPKVLSWKEMCGTKGGTAKRPPGFAKAQARAHATRAKRTASVIFAEAVTTNWLAGRERKRAHPKPPRQRRTLMERLTLPGGGRMASAGSGAGDDGGDDGASVPGKPQRGGIRAWRESRSRDVTDPTETPEAPPDDDSSPADDIAPPQPAPRDTPPAPAPSPPPNGDSPMTTPADTNGSGTAGDYLSALHHMLTSAWQGGLRSKTRAHLALGEGFPQHATALEQHAKALSETGLYPASVVERVLKAARFVRAAGNEMAESGAELAAIAATPAGELGRRTPARDELVNQ